jgi:hypothetical protein
LVNNVNGNIVGVNGSGVRPIASIINPTLVSNGGPTLTHALLVGSPAIDAGSNVFVLSGVTTDQRGAGHPRVINNVVDIGAFETPVWTGTTLTATPNASTGGQLVTFTATVAPSPGASGTMTFKDNSVALPGGANVALVGGVATFQISTLAPGTRAITAAYSGAADFAPSTSNTVNFVVSDPPQVTSVALNGNLPSLAGVQRSRVVSLMVAFNQAVQLDADAITIALHTNNVSFNGVLQPGGLGAAPALVIAPSADKTTWTVTFAGAKTEVGADQLASLVDGVYDLAIAAAKVHPLGSPGVSMAASSLTTFHRLSGDTGAPDTPGGGTPGVDFSAVVNTADNLAFRSAFNRPAGGGYLAYLDFNGDGVVNTADNLQFRSRFNKSLIWRQ